MPTRGELEAGEAHPACEIAKQYLMSLPGTKLAQYLESFSSVALSGNRMAEICAGTLSRLIDRKPVSDRYFLGLCVAIWSMEESKRGKK